MIAARDPRLPLPPLRSAGGACEHVVPSAPPGGGRDAHPEDGLLSGPPRVINVGLAAFAESLRAQGVAVADVDWRPPAGGDRDMIALLERLE
jgi:FdrA protein